MGSNILFIAGISGAPLDFAIPLLKNKGTLYVLAPINYPITKKSIIDHLADYAIYRDIDSLDTLEINIRDIVISNNINAIITFDEFSIESINKVAKEFGLLSSGNNTYKSRNKYIMRECFYEVGLNNPKYKKVTSYDELKSSLEIVGTPAVLKLISGAASIGHTIFNEGDDHYSKWIHTNDLISSINNDKSLIGNTYDLENNEYILESFIEASTDSWYEEDGFGDLISVEGLVKNGVYYPIALTSKLPMIEPFTEVAQITPCVLSIEKQKKIIDYAKKAVDSLGLENCGTHTEIKLQANGGLCMVESAARLPGAVIVKQIYDALDIDLIGLLTEILLGNDPTIPDTQFSLIDIAAGPLGLVSMNSKFEHWNYYPKLNKNIDFNNYFPFKVDYTIQWMAGSIEGERIKQYNPKIGAANYIAIFYFKTRNQKELVTIQRFLLDNAERIFTENEIK